MTAKNPPKHASTSQNSQSTQTISQRAAETKASLEAKKAAKAAANVKALDKVISVIQTLREISPAMTLNQALVFLEVAKGCQGDEGRVENLEVRRRTGLNSITMSTTVAILSDLGRDKKEGLELINLSESDTDGRAKSLYLTDRGRNLAEKIFFLSL